MKKIIVLMLLGFVGLSVPWINASQTSTNYFVTSPHQTYYPATKLGLSFINLAIAENYNLLIGANQNKPDWQWYNFTAASTMMTITVIHFDHQSLVDNTSQTIQNLLLELYYNGARVDWTFYKVQSIKNDFTIPAWVVLLASGIGVFVSALIAYVIVKYIILKLM